MSDFTEYLQRPSNPEMLDLQVESLMTALRADPLLKEAYLRSFDIHRCGLPAYDAQIKIQDTKLKQGSMARYADSLAKLSDLTQDGPTKAAKNVRPTAKYLNSVTTRAKKMTPIALEAGSLAGPMDLLTFNYLLESDLHKELSVRELEESDARFLWGSEAAGGTYPAIDITTRMDELEIRDRSPERLSARFENFLALTQFEAGRVFIDALTDFTVLSQHRPKRFQQAIRLKEKYFEALGTADLKSKTAMLTDMANLCRNHQQSPEKTPLKALEDICRRVLRQMDRNLDTYRAVYRHFGIPLHPELAPPVPTTLGKAATGTAVVSPEARSREASPAELYEQFVAKHEAVTTPWRWTANTKATRRSFNEMVHTLVIGYTGRDLSLPGMPKEDVQELLGILQRTQLLAQELPIPEAQAIVEKAIAAQRELAEEAETSVWRSDSAYPRPRILPLDKYFAALRTDWPTYRQLILDHWPDGHGPRVATRINTLLFEQAEEAPAVEQELGQVATEAVLKEMRIAEALDAIILPPSPTPRDVTQALESLNPSGERVSHVQWSRLFDLAAIREEKGGVLYRSKKTLGESRGYFILVFEEEGSTFAIAEPLLLRNATYVVAEELTGGTWLEVLTQHKRDARELGAKRIRHAQNAQGRDHIKKIYEVIADFKKAISSRKSTLL